MDTSPTSTPDAAQAAAQRRARAFQLASMYATRRAAQAARADHRARTMIVAAHAARRAQWSPA